jgi:hypothetical protein
MKLFNFLSKKKKPDFEKIFPKLSPEEKDHHLKLLKQGMPQLRNGSIVMFREKEHIVAIKAYEKEMVEKYKDI